MKTSFYCQQKNGDGGKNIQIPVHGGQGKFKYFLLTVHAGYGKACASAWDRMRNQKLRDWSSVKVGFSRH